MGLLPTPRDYAAREAARHCRSLADHLLDADPMARPAPPLRHLSPPRPVHRPTRPHEKPSLGRCGDLRSLSRGGVTRPASAGRGSARRASARCGGSTTSSCARCQLHRPTLTQQPHPCTPHSTHRVFSTVPSSQPGALLDGLSHALRRTLCLEGARRRARLRARLRVRSTRHRSGAHASIASHPRTGWRRRRASKRGLTTNPNPNPDPNPSPHPRQTMCFLSKRKLTAREIEGDLAAEIEIELEIGAELGGAAPRRRSLGARSARSGASSPRDPQPPRRASWPVAPLYAARCVVAPARG